MDAYIRPEIKVVDIELEHIVATSLLIEQEQEEYGVADVQGRRGSSWGDLWK